jgi:hypothetical protein
VTQICSEELPDWLAVTSLLVAQLTGQHFFAAYLPDFFLYTVAAELSGLSLPSILDEIHSCLAVYSCLAR